MSKSPVHQHGIVSDECFGAFRGTDSTIFTCPFDGTCGVRRIITAAKQIGFRNSRQLLMFSIRCYPASKGVKKNCTSSALAVRGGSTRVDSPVHNSVKSAFLLCFPSTFLRRCYDFSSTKRTFDSTNTGSPECAWRQSIIIIKLLIIQSILSDSF